MNYHRKSNIKEAIQSLCSSDGKIENLSLKLMTFQAVKLVHDLIAVFHRSGEDSDGQPLQLTFFDPYCNVLTSAVVALKFNYTWYGCNPNLEEVKAGKENIGKLLVVFHSNLIRFSGIMIKQLFNSVSTLQQFTESVKQMTTTPEASQKPLTEEKAAPEDLEVTPSSSPRPQQPSALSPEMMQKFQATSLTFSSN